MLNTCNYNLQKPDSTGHFFTLGFAFRTIYSVWIFLKSFVNVRNTMTPPMIRAHMKFWVSPTIHHPPLLITILPSLIVVFLRNGLLNYRRLADASKFHMALNEGITAAT